ncbi:MAG: hypothetical protein K2I73_05480 [Eubacterium sp.]|nr:hypothetical protein [Eubacterium sp.]
MRYYTTFNGSIVPELEKFIVKQNETKDVFLVSFDDNDIDYIIDYAADLVFIDEHKKYYKIEGKKLIPTDEKFKFSPKIWYKMFCFIYKNLHREERRVQNKLSSKDKTSVVKQGFDIGAFKSYNFIDKENKIAYAFRFKKSKGKEKQPLVIFFCGAGSVGLDNVKPFIECIPMLGKLNKRNCNILIPQPLTTVNYNKSYEDFNSKFDAYISSIHNLVNLLTDKENIDTNRIYAFGTSLGGCCTWRLVYNFPELCACTVPVVGRFDLKIEASPYTDFERIAHIPMWVAHSSDDKIIDVEYDDFAVAELKKLGADIKYTRWDKYGHGMAGRFYHKEDWCNWMFEQNKKS